ncbi:reverse transcriptase domain-containing protein [uncultured Brachyspira sp.]|uniref:reverse transcriptase domain-containing protein n=1 Tax=uncultured Brachyspira sp. TaxID=221953 RepID=UPI002582ADCD|nr:reverse transcriptase domain-containing protein [uncultured Brachyspira sp.]
MTSNEKRKEKRYQRRKEKRLKKKLYKNKTFDNFNNLIDPDKLLKAYYSCRKGVSWKYSVQQYESNLIRNIIESIRKLKNGESVIRECINFKINERGKVRNIRSVHIAERVIQKALCDYILVPVLSKSLINDNGASMKGKGCSFTRKRLVRHISEYYRKNKNNAGYVLTIDFKKYFGNINHKILIDMLEKEITDKKVMELVKQFIYSFGDKGLCLGSQLSQICAVYYANKLDHFIKEKLRVRWYGRYMDDSYLIASSKEELKRYLREIEKVCSQLGIIINEKKTQIFKLNKGFKFLKGTYILTDTGKVVRKPAKENIIRMRRKLKKVKKLLEKGKMTFNDIRNLYMSWRGHIKHFNSWRSTQRMHSLFYKLFFN